MNKNKETFDKKWILLTNDDGYSSPGIKALARSLRKVARVFVVAPDRERSAIGHGLTFFNPIRAHEIRNDDGLVIYKSDGTPTDCVLLGIHQLMETPPDLVISGINRGANLGDDVTYSGTVGAAMEGAIQAIPSIAVSLNSMEEFDFESAARFTAGIAEILLQKKLPDGVFLNINIPAIDFSLVKGVEITFQGRSIYHQKIVKRVDPKGNNYYWITGATPDGEPIEGSDFWAVKNNSISITPLHLSLTNMSYIDELKNWKFSI
ncbi:MAG: 5'/3'-nucleotidase SurE [Candidatus Eremiobacteraeota bacterium]|nr:5'/3'-nucleotidase SurE [Candidatus Eremiobacteraeota bacterium]